MIDGKTCSRILIVTRNLPPLVGGMERLNWHVAKELGKVAEVRVIGPAGSTALAPAGIPVVEAPLAPSWRFLWVAHKLAKREARAWKPDVVLAGSGLTAPIALSAARTCNARPCVYVHGLDVAVRHPVYRALWLPAIRKASRVIANSSATAALCRAAGVASDRIGIVHPGVDLPPSAEGDDDRARDFRLRYGFEQRHLLLSVGRLSTRKGLIEFVSRALPEIVRRCPNVVLAVIGDAPRNALHAEAQTPQGIREAAERAGVGRHVEFLGSVSDVELEDAYQAARVHVFPIRKIPGDPEGFGMVAIEAAAHGLPTVAFAVGGVVDAVKEGVSGRLIREDDYAAFADGVLALLGADPRAMRDSCRDFALGFAWEQMGRQLFAQFDRALSGSKHNEVRNAE
jgi:phosphatidylinositol alpha-1,6-mannosyltransferase